MLDVLEDVDIEQSVERLGGVEIDLGPDPHCAMTGKLPGLDRMEQGIRQRGIGLQAHPAVGLGLDEEAGGTTLAAPTSRTSRPT